MISERDIRREIELAIKDRYARTPENTSRMEQIFDAVKLFTLESSEKTSVQSILQDAARTIYTSFGFNEINIGLRSEIDGKYRTELVFGRTKEAEAWLRAHAYTMDEMRPCKKYPGIMVSKAVEFAIREDKSYTEEEIASFNRPSKLNEERKSLTEMGEGDYIDIYIFGARGDILGWIGLSNPRDKQIPEREALLGLELMAQIIGLAIQRKDLEK